ncbi:MAG TPA: hypothetical protein VK760_15135 [Candidatus Acidoferrales bacterium]|nr:hypothetical protein [Candidatus Acidoferrales bacterium]
MHLKLSRFGIAALVAVALGACSGQSSVPSAGPQSVGPDKASIAPFAMQAMPFGHAISPDAASPCNVGIWYFRGSCVAVDIPSKANSVSLKTYKTFAITLNFPKSKANNASFIIGDGTGSKDITGTLSGAKFPVYGSIPCITTKGKTVKCPGTAFLYVFVANASAGTVSFPAIPSSSVTTTGKFPGKTCSPIALQGTQAWILIPLASKVKGNTFGTPALKDDFSFPSRTFAVLGFTCQ